MALQKYTFSGLLKEQRTLWSTPTQHFEMSHMCLLRKHKKMVAVIAFCNWQQHLISDLAFWGRTCVKQAAVHQNQNILPRSYKKGPGHKRTDNYNSTNIMNSKCNWWWVELFFQIKKKKNQTIFNMFRESYSTANIFMLFLYLHCTGTFYSKNTQKTGWLISICETF